MSLTDAICIQIHAHFSLLICLLNFNCKMMCISHETAQYQLINKGSCLSVPQSVGSVSVCTPITLIWITHKPIIAQLWNTFHKTMWNWSFVIILITYLYTKVIRLWRLVCKIISTNLFFTILHFVSWTSQEVFVTSQWTSHQLKTVFKTVIVSLCGKAFLYLFFSLACRTEPHHYGSDARYQTSQDISPAQNILDEKWQFNATNNFVFIEK